MSDPVKGSRREFLSGGVLRKKIEATGEAIADELANERSLPPGGPTFRLETSAMACDFAVLLDQPLRSNVPLERISSALDTVHAHESQMTVYRQDSELMRINREAADGWVDVSENLYDLLRMAVEISRATDGAFDITAGPLIRLWADCRREGRIPTDDEIKTVRRRIGYDRIEFDDEQRRIRFADPELTINLGGIGKGEALDRIASRITAAGQESFLLHGGYSSLLARGTHAGGEGWPITLRDPVTRDRSLGTLVIRNCALSTSGSGTQFFRYRGRRYGHLLDPRTGWPVEDLLSVSVTASTAALADALSTAFSVLGVENALGVCDTYPEVGCVFVPSGTGGRALSPIVHHLQSDDLFLRD